MEITHLPCTLLTLNMVVCVASRRHLASTPTVWVPNTGKKAWHLPDGMGHLMVVIETEMASLVCKISDRCLYDAAVGENTDHHLVHVRAARRHAKCTKPIRKQKSYLSSNITLYQYWNQIYRKFLHHYSVWYMLYEWVVESMCLNVITVALYLYTMIIMFY